MDSVESAWQNSDTKLKCIRCAVISHHVHVKLSYPNVDHSISPVTFQRVQLQVPLKVPRIQSRDGQAVPVTSLDKNKQEFISI